MKIAVLMSAYNGERYISQQIGSILRQEIDGELRLFVRDDGSRDRTAQIVEEAAAKDPRVTLMRGENLGVVGSFFALIKAADALRDEYDYFSFSDQDDVWDPDKLRAATDMIRASGRRCVLYGSCSRLTDDALKPYGVTQTRRRPMNFYNVMIQTIMPSHSQVMDGELLHLCAGEVDISKIYVHDFYITDVAALNGTLLFDNTPHTSYRQHSDNVLGYGRGIAGWIAVRLRRVRSGDSRKIAVQMKYVCEKYRDRLNSAEAAEIDRFFSAQKNFFTRLGYCLTTKFYRQKMAESAAFRLLYLTGGYGAE